MRAKIRTCVICGNTFTYKQTRGKLVCSDICYRKYMSKIRFGKGNPRFNNGWRQYRNKMDDKTNCYVCGCGGKLEIHHRDKNKRNNDLSNLMRICRRCHMMLDGRMSNLKNHNSQTGMCAPVGVMPIE